MRIAVISDIHSNLIALKAVLADIKQAGADQIICLGDIANVGPHPSQCIDLIRDLNCPVLQGNHELYLLGQLDDIDWQTSPIWAGMRWSRRQLRPDQMAYIADLPFQYEIAGNGRAPAVFVHGSPLSQFKGFLPRHNNEAIAQRMNGLDGVTLFAGHTHIPLYRPWSDSWLVNVGSVGMPLDNNPAAKYTIATQQRQSWRVEFRMVPYNTDQLMADFDATGLQKTGGKITAAFRQQMFTGKAAFVDYLQTLQKRAEVEGITVDQAYDLVDAPPQIQRWLHDEEVKK